MFKLRSILWEFKLLKFIDEARVFRKALHGSTRSICVYQFFMFLLQGVLRYVIFVIKNSNPES